jgi:L-fuconolactonase
MAIHKFPVVDAQIHVWKASTPERPWPPDAIEPQRIEPLEVPEVEFEMKLAGVDAALLLGPTWEGARNDYVLQVAAAQPHKFGALCRFPTSDPAAVEQLTGWRDTTGMRGIRLSLNRGDVAGMVASATSSGFFDAAQTQRIPLSIYAPGRHRLYADLAESFPGLSITVDHCAVEGVRVPLADAIAPLLELARYPGIAVKASALPCFVDDGFPSRSIVDAVYRLVDAFGPQRVFFGSDLSRLPIPYPQLVKTFTDHLPRLGEDERALVLGGALAQWLNWPEPLAAATSAAAPSNGRRTT